MAVGIHRSGRRPAWYSWGDSGGEPVKDIRLNYLPGHALLTIGTSSEHICYLVAQDFGRHIDPNDAKLTACDS